MIDRMKTCALLLLMSFVGFAAGSPAIAQDAAWRVSKVSGDVSVTSSITPVALTDGASLKPGDSIRTGKNGRVLLTRGQETILVSPNSALGIPRDKTDGMSTTIVQQAGSILLDVEKRNVKHFEVETPYLAAVVKGTQFRVTVNDSSANVDVVRGQVEVVDLKSGQYALVQQNQVAGVSAQGASGLSLSGPGTLSPIQQGTPRAPSMSLPPAASPSQAAAPAPATLEALAAPQRDTSEPQTRVASPPAAASQPAATQYVPAPPPGTTSFESVRNSTMTSLRSFLGMGSAKRDRNEDITLAFALAGAVGVAVSVGGSAQRRRRRKK